MTSRLDNLILTMILRTLLIYILFIHTSWTIYACKIQTKMYGKGWRTILCIMLNFIFCPFAIIIAFGKRSETDETKIQTNSTEETK
jgi:hypothetical protein